VTAVSDGPIEPASVRFGRLAIGVIAPIAVAGAAYALWWISDRLVVIGPLDRASFGWVVVIPVWLSTPIVAGLAWRALERPEVAIAAATVGGIVGAIAAALFWRSVSAIDCAYGATHAATDWVVPSLLIGSAVGGGVALGGLLATSEFRRGRRGRAAILAPAASLALLFLAAVIAVGVSLGPGCQRPPL
jgi:hypothetical protein